MHATRLSLCVASLLIHASLCRAEVADPKLVAILKAYDKRNNNDERDNKAEANRAWLKTKEGREEALYLAEHFDDLQGMRKSEVPTELARTGVMEAVPLIAKALAIRPYGLEVLDGMSYACHIGTPEKDYGPTLAPAVVPLIGKGFISDHDEAVDLLPLLDRDLAAHTFFTDQYLSPESPLVHVVLSSCNDAVLKVPKDRIEALLEVWHASGQDPGAPFRIRSGFRQAVRALAAHDTGRAEKMIQEIVHKHPDQAYDYSEVLLAVAGLTGLYEKLLDLAGDPVRFGGLPEQARIYFAIMAFREDCANGGFEQALRNSTGDYLPMVRKGYQEIGDLAELRFLDWMCKPFGPGVPSPDQRQRVLQMDAMKPSYGEQEEQLRQSWVNRSRGVPDVSDGWLLSQYAARHSSILKPLLDLKVK